MTPNRKSERSTEVNIKKAVAVCGALALLWVQQAQAAPFSSEAHDVYAGDFNGDGKGDLLVIAKDPAGLSGIYATDASGQPTTQLQSWNAGFLGILWHSSRYTAVIGNFDGTGGDDVLLQRNGAGSSFLLPTNAQGQLFGISQYINGWGSDSYRIIAGKFDGNAREDVLLQARQPSGTHSIVVTDGNGHLTITNQAWANNHLGFKWSVANAILHTGDFNNDGRDDLLLQAKAEIALIDYDIPIPVPVFKANAFGIMLATPAGQFTSTHDLFSRNELGLDFAPGEVDIVIGDFDGLNGDDISLLARKAGKSSYVVRIDANATLTPAGAVNLGAGTLGAELRTLAADFNGDGRSELYRVAANAGGSNSIVSFTSSGSIAANVAHSAPPISGPVIASVGRTLGVGDVANNGAATYTIPISTPPGTAGLAPQLAFTYSSRNGASPLGVGWGIAGLSHIDRCPSIWHSNGFSRNVRGDAADRFCLDGSRLKYVAGPAYGGDGTRYSTEIENFARIRSFGAAGTGPAYFSVEQKNGLIFEYGNSADSRIELGSSSTARAWALNKVRDRNGNAILFNYTEDSANGTYRIASIQYTANPGQGIAAAYQVTFSYEALPQNEVDVSYMGGAIIRRVTRLDRVDITHSSGTLVRRYEVTFEPNLSSTNSSRLQSIRECAGAPLACLPATTFSYQNGTPGLLAGETSTLNSTDIYSPLSIDINGDGRTDFVYTSSSYSAGNWVFALANPDGSYTTPVNSGIPSTEADQPAIPIDYNGDGRQDFLMEHTGNRWWVVLGTANGLVGPYDTGVPVNPLPESTTTMDVNGDGLDDLVTVDNTNVFYRYRELAGTFSAPAAMPLGLSGVRRVYISNYRQFQSRNRHPSFNGDARKSLMLYIESSLANYSLRIIQSGTESIETDFVFIPLTLDINGDGQSDVLGVGEHPGNFSFMLSNGMGFGPEFVGPAVDPALDFINAVVVDWDADGDDDLVVPNIETKELMLARSSGQTLLPFASTGRFLANQYGYLLVADVNGDGLDDLLQVSGTKITRFLHAGVAPDMLQSATDGYGNLVNFQYAPLSSGANYTKYSDAQFPEQDYQGPTYVVSTITQSNGIGGTFTHSYTYFGARMQAQGRGFEGFYARASQDSRTGLQIYDYFNRTYPYTGRPSARHVYQSNGSTLIARDTVSYGAYTYGAGAEGRAYPYVSSATQHRYEFGGAYNAALLNTTTTTSTVDSVTGETTDSTTTVVEGTGANGGGPGRTHTLRTYVPELFTDVTNWCIGRPARTQQINGHTGPGGAPQTRTSAITWVGDYCRPSQQFIEPDSTQWRVATDVAYDAFGNQSTLLVYSHPTQGQASRQTQFYWGTDGHLLRSVTNAKGQTTQFSWNEALGLRASVTDPNARTTTWTYDVFGRTRRQQLPDGTATDIVRRGCVQGGFTDVDCGVADLRTSVDVVARDAGNGIIRTDSQLLDAFERPRYQYSQLLNQGRAIEITTYDALGRVSSESTPYIENLGPVWYTNYTYDVLGRVKQIQRPSSEADSSTHLTQFAYLGLTATSTDALSRTTTRKLDALGQVLQTIDPLGVDVDYEYDAFGQLMKTRDVNNTEIVLTYNVRGFKMSSNDPDLGAWTYDYFPLGELKSQTDARGNPVSFTYDGLSRPLTRVEPEGTTTWTWDTATKGIGQLATISSPGGYSETYLYDSLGRPSQQSILADGATYLIDQTYTNQGQLDTLTYPTSTASVRFKVQYGYANGLLQSVRDYTGNVLGTTFWQGLTTNARGQLLDEQLGNGVRTLSNYDRITGLLNARSAGVGGGTGIQHLAYQFDKLGNLAQRQDLRQSLTETFTYDALDRLDFSKLNGTVNLDLAYNAIGNITSRSDVGNYTYDPTKKHAVTAAGSNTYTYDANGNAITRNGQSITWTSYNLPSLINGTGGSSSSFSYNPARQRWKQTASYGGTAETTTYIGGILEKVVLGGVASWRHHIFGADGEVAIYTRKSTGTNELHYLSKDHLGSTDVITSSAGAAEVRSSFAAFGQRRNAAGWSGNPSAADGTAITGTTRHGYTGHEMLDNLNLTHMNGRVYDQITGRFLSADPFVQAPFNGQSLNRYSYVFNNPLSSTDPSGFFCGGPDAERCGGGVIDLILGFAGQDPLGGLFPASRFENAELIAFLNGAGIGGGVPERLTPVPSTPPGVVIVVTAETWMGNSTVGGFVPDGVVRPVPPNFFTDDLIGIVLSGAIGDPIARVRGAISGNYLNPLSDRFLDSPKRIQDATIGAILLLGGPLTGAGGTARTAVALDANALISAIEGQGAALVALGNRIPIVSIRAAREFARGSYAQFAELGGAATRRASIQRLREFLSATGGRIGRAGTQEQSDVFFYSNGIKPGDAEVLGSAANEGVKVLTRDRKLIKNFSDLTERF
jgi:RHS repeat-associated protein